MGPTKFLHRRAMLQILGSACLAIACTAEPLPDTGLAPQSSTARPVDSSATTQPPETTTTQPPVQLDEPYLIVDADATPGGSGTIDDPIQRPRDAFNLVEPGTTVYFRGGTYRDTEVGNNLMQRSGTEDAWITFTPFPGEQVTVDAGGEWGNGFEVIGASYIRITGFTILGRTDSIHGSGVFAKEESHDITVTDNYIEGFGGAGISVVRSARLHAEGNTIRGNAMRSFFQGSGISIYQPIGPVTADGPSNVIRNNYVVGNFNGVLSREDRLTDGNCIIIDFFNETDYQGQTLVENNTCIDNGGRGIHVFNSSHVLARNNTLIGNVRSDGLNGGKAEMVASQGIDIRFYNNLVLNRSGIASFHISDDTEAVFGNNLVAEGPVPPGSSNSILVNPDPLESTSGADPFGAHRPTANSEAIGAADASMQSQTDAAGADRPVPGSAGAFEPLAAG